MRRAAVLGRPVTHSRSPVIHRAGFAAAGLTGWTYDALECGEEELPGLVAGLGPEWVGLSLTMPLKEVALAVATGVTPLAAALGAANTLVRMLGGGWRAENTDAPGIADAVGDMSPGPMVVLGSGGTARAALGAAVALSAGPVTVVSRQPEQASRLRSVAAALGVELAHRPWPEAAEALGAAGLVVSTVPAGAADDLAGQVAWRRGSVLLDVLYHPWPTPLASSAAAAGARVVSGLDLLLAQGVRQFEMFTGVPAPVAAMRAALAAT
jgi:shikimate dehydrogenase